MSRIDLRKAFKQLFRDISQMYLLATMVDEFVFIEATMSMGLRNTCKLFEEEFMKAFVKGLIHHHPELFKDNLGNLVDNYLDDVWFLADTVEKNKLQLLVAEYWAEGLDIELNHDKTEPACSTTRHLGFSIDLKQKLITATKKHKRKIMGYFKGFLWAARLGKGIRIKYIQKLLGLQIWISTVFPVTREFLTSTCDILRISGTYSHFHPRKHQGLVARTIADLKFWRNFISRSPTATFDFILNRLPVNRHFMASDASTSVGMAGVLFFGEPCSNFPEAHGLFWQLSWEEWAGIFSKSLLSSIPGRINVAEFLAALITCETFANFCSKSLTILKVDNVTAKMWLASSRCPKYPLDWCAQSARLHMLEEGIKIKAVWIPSEENTFADLFSRKHFSRRSQGHLFGNSRFIKVKPRWKKVTSRL